MGIKKFIKSVVSFLKIENFATSSKKKSMKNLLKKLKDRRLKIYKSLKMEEEESKKVQLQEELDIISMQIKKGKKILNKLNNN